MSSSKSIGQPIFNFQILKELYEYLDSLYIFIRRGNVQNDELDNNLWEVYKSTCELKLEKCSTNIAEMEFLESEIIQDPQDTWRPELGGRDEKVVGAATILKIAENAVQYIFSSEVGQEREVEVDDIATDLEDLKEDLAELMEE